MAFLSKTAVLSP